MDLYTLEAALNWLVQLYTSRSTESFRMLQITFETVKNILVFVNITKKIQVPDIFLH